MFGGRSSRHNFRYFSSLSDGLALLRLCECGFEYSTTFRDMVPSGPHGLLLRRELGRLFGLRLCHVMAFRPLDLRTGSTGSLRVGGFASIPLTATMIVSSVVVITVGALLLFLCNSALSFQNVWATTGHARRGIIAITLCITEALAVFAQYGSLGSLICLNCHSETTESYETAHLADKGPTSNRHYEVRCGEHVLCRVGMTALRAELQHRLNRNSEDFQLLLNILLGQVLDETFNKESSTPVFWQAVGMESHTLACIDRPQHLHLGREAVGSFRTGKKTT